MQSLDNSVTVERKKSGLGKGMLTSRQGHGAANPKFIPAAEESARSVASEINGFAGSAVSDLLGRTLTAHFLGGCVIGDSPESGVIDPYQRLYGYPGITVADGSSVSANLGVNPSLTITAQAERAMAFWPNKGEADPRPAQGEAYRRVAPVAPSRPAVAADAFAALKVTLPVPVVPPKR
jgi:cholesterol oxidase